MPVVVSCTTRFWAGPEAKGFLEMHLQGQPLAEAPPRRPQSPRTLIPVFSYLSTSTKTYLFQATGLRTSSGNQKGPPVGVLSSEGDQLRAGKLSDPGK